MSRFKSLFQQSESESHTTPETYNENPVDCNGDELVQEDTKFERPVATSKKTKKVI